MKGYIIGRANIVDQQKSENYKPKAAYESDEYKKALGVLGDGMERTLVIVEGEEETK